MSSRTNGLLICPPGVALPSTCTVWSDWSRASLSSAVVASFISPRIASHPTACQVRPHSPPTKSSADQPRLKLLRYFQQLILQPEAAVGNLRPGWGRGSSAPGLWNPSVWFQIPAQALSSSVTLGIWSKWLSSSLKGA